MKGQLCHCIIKHYMLISSNQNSMKYTVGIIALCGRFNIHVCNSSQVIQNIAMCRNKKITQWF
ncbi:hypothetical protein Hanom_Chr03g00198301 [Helianthus anomalus]